MNGELRSNQSVGQVRECEGALAAIIELRPEDIDIIWRRVPKNINERIGKERYSKIMAFRTKMELQGLEMPIPFNVKMIALYALTFVPDCSFEELNLILNAAAEKVLGNCKDAKIEFLTIKEVRQKLAVTFPKRSFLDMYH